MSRARKTRPIPPSPSCDVTSKTPIRVPGVTAIRSVIIIADLSRRQASFLQGLIS